LINIEMNGEQATGRQAGKRFAPRPAVKSREERETEGEIN
jgi:hypothetical protein